MHPLSAQQLLQIWEIGQQQHPIDRALTLLSFALPGRTVEELVQLSIGQRDAYLLTLRELTLGPQMESYAECPHCQEKLEFSLKVTDLRVVEPTAAIPSQHHLKIEDVEIQFTLPNSQDLAAIAHCPNLTTARQALIQCCIQQVSQNGTAIAINQLAPAVLDQLSAYMAECDPQAELLLDLVCPACQHQWQVLFDIVSFFWTELSAQAKRLLREVHTLARGYGWREADILAMSARRRQLYLDLVTDG
jgi:hypothetical protein